MEDGRSRVIIERLLDMVENGQNVTFSSGKVAVNKDEAVLLLNELKNLVDGELKIYREVNDRKGRIITEAKKEAEEIIYEAEQTASRIRVTKRVSNYGTGFRDDGLEEEERMALRTAHDIYAASVIYTDEMLTEVTDVVAEAYDIITNQYGRMVTVLEEKAKMIADNKAELMNGLRELSKEERYSQIMELSQLLANELYNEKHRRDEYEEITNAQIDDVMNAEDSAFNDNYGYNASTDSAFGDGAAYYDEPLVESEDNVSTSAFAQTEEEVSTSAFAQIEEEVDTKSVPSYGITSGNVVHGSTSTFIDAIDSALGNVKNTDNDSAFENVMNTDNDSVFENVMNTDNDSVFGSESKTDIDSAFSSDFTLYGFKNEYEEKKTEEDDDKYQQLSFTDEMLSGTASVMSPEIQMEKRTMLEEKILEKPVKEEFDNDGVKFLHPVNQYENQKDPIANTLNMFKRARAESEERRY